MLEMSLSSAMLITHSNLHIQDSRDNIPRILPCYSAKETDEVEDVEGVQGMKAT